MLSKHSKFKGLPYQLGRMLNNTRFKESKVGREAIHHLFMFTPVISTTFASLHRLLTPYGIDKFGYVLIDEAGQTSPQSAVGAAMIAKNMTVVGDPLQLEPIQTLPDIILDRVEQEYSEYIDIEKWGNRQANLQTVADRSNYWQAKFENGPSVGCPSPYSSSLY